MELTLKDLRALPPEDLTGRLLDASEDQWFDRKSGRVAAKELAKTIVAMANAEGGLIAIGLHAGKPDHFGTAQVNAWRQTSLDLVRPPIQVSTDELQGSWVAVAHRVVLLSVEPSETLVSTTADDVYLRVGDEDRRLSFDQRRQLMFDKGQAQFEATTVAGITPADLDDTAIASYAATVGGSDPWRTLQARSLIAPDDTIRVAAIVGFARQPDQWLPQHIVRVIRYRGTHRLVGERQNIATDIRMSAPLGILIPEVREVVRRELPSRRALGSDGRFSNVGLIPEPAWLEAIVNALIHRSYSNAGDHIRVEVFDDALRVESPGRFPGVVDLKEPHSIVRFARNPRIARLAADLRFGQELGEGLRRMYEEMTLAGLVEPEFHQTSGSVQVLLSGRPVDAQLEARLPSRSRELLQVVREQDHPSTGDIVKTTGWSRPSVLKALRALTDEGLVEWVGQSQNDPRAYWRIRDDHRTLNSLNYLH